MVNYVLHSIFLSMFGTLGSLSLSFDFCIEASSTDTEKDVTDKSRSFFRLCLLLSHKTFEFHLPRSRAAAAHRRHGKNFYLQGLVISFIMASGGGGVFKPVFLALLAQLIFTECVREPSKYASRPPPIASDKPSMFPPLSPLRTASDERSMFPPPSPPRTASDERSMFPPPSPPRTASDERSVFSTTLRMERPSRPRLRSCLPNC